MFGIGCTRGITKLFLEKLMHFLLDKINGLFEQKQNFCLAYITAKRGTAPRDPGAAMIIADGKPAGGSIGGGALEHLVCAQAPKALQNAFAVALSLRVEFGQAEFVRSGGNLDILLDPIKATDSGAQAVFRAAADILGQGKSCFLLSVASTGHGPAAGHALIDQNGLIAGTLPADVDPAGLKQSDLPEVIEIGSSKLFGLPLNPAPAVFILGSGHVAGALAPLMASLDFRVVVADDLSQAADSPAAKAADSFLMRPFDQPFGPEGPGPNDYVVCMARTHQFDRLSLGQVLGRKPAYVGMIGSSRKKKQVFEWLAQDGFDDHTLEKIHCPIGLSIGARTPREIAVSIAGEIIAARAQSQGRKL